jgi:hypothetical protein
MIKYNLKNIDKGENLESTVILTGLFFALIYKIQNLSSSNLFGCVIL